MTREQGNSHDRSSYLPRQLLALSVCAAVGLVAIVVYHQGSYTRYVLWSGIAVLTLVAVQITFLATLRRGNFQARVHEQNPWRYVILSMPVVLYLLVPLNHRLDQAEAGTTDLIRLDFETFINGANDPDERARLEGKIGVLKGQYAENSKSNLAFGLVRLKNRHERPPSVAVLSDVSVTSFKFGEWVQVTGEIEYRRRKDEYCPVLNAIIRTDRVGDLPSFD